MRTALSGCLTAAVFMGFATPTLDASEPWSQAAEGNPAVTCHSRGDVAGSSRHLAMLQRHVSRPGKPVVFDLAHVGGRRSVSVAFAGEEHGLGQRARLSEEGFRNILRLQSKRESYDFVRRVMSDLRMKVISEKGFGEFVASLPDIEDFNGLRWSLEEQSRQPCGFVRSSDKAIDVDGASAPLTEDGYWKVVAMRDKQKMVSFAKRVMENEGLHLDDEDKLMGMVGYYSCETVAQSLQKMREEFRRIATDPCGFVHSKRKGIDVDGSSAPLTDDGYWKVAARRDITEMESFAKRVMIHEGLHTDDHWKLLGMLGYYSCEHGAQSLQAMFEEFRRVAAAPDGWVHRTAR